MCDQTHIQDGNPHGNNNYPHDQPSIPAQEQRQDTEPQEPPNPQRRPPVLNTINLRTNTVYGNKMQLPKQDGITRLLSMNINSIKQANDYQDAREIAQALKISGVNIWNFQETNLNWKSQCQSKCYEQYRRVYHHARIATSSSIITYPTLYQPGGTMCAVTDNYVGRVVESGSDKELGRWSFTRVLGKHGRHIVIVSAYQVCDQREKDAGPRTAFAQQLSLL